MREKLERENKNQTKKLAQHLTSIVFVISIMMLIIILLSMITYLLNAGNRHCD